VPCEKSTPPSPDPCLHEQRGTEVLGQHCRNAHSSAANPAKPRLEAPATPEAGEAKCIA